MADNFVSYERDTLFLFPPSVQEWLPGKHFAPFAVDLVSQLDLRETRNCYGGRGSAAYHPEMLVALLFYAFAISVRASRKGGKNARPLLGRVWKEKRCSW